MKALSILLSIFVLLIVVAVIGVGCLVYFVDPNKLKPVIMEEVMKQTGYQLVIDGNLSWSFYPSIGVKVEYMTLSEPKGVPFAELRGVTIATELSQLLHGNQKMRGALHIDDVRFANLHAQDAKIGLRWQDNVLTLSPITASLYDGTFNGIAHGKDLSTTMHWDWDALFSHIQIKPLLQDVNGEDSKIMVAGVGQVRMIAQTQGKSRDDIFKNLNGSVEYSLNKGAVEGVDLNYMVETVDALLNNKPVAALKNNNQTDFTSLGGSAQIKDGVAETNNTALVAPTFQAAASGTINLIYQAINFQLKLSPPNQKWEMPVLITGSLRHPDVRLDMVEVQKYIVKEKLVKVKEKVKEEIKEHIHGKTGEFLQNLLK